MSHEHLRTSRRCHTIFLAAALMLMVCGCQGWLMRSADNRVYRAISQRQMDALGETHDAHIGEEDGRFDRSGDLYAFVPNPVSAGVPESFQTTRAAEPSAPTPVVPEAQPYPPLAPLVEPAPATAPAPAARTPAGEAPLPGEVIEPAAPADGQTTEEPLTEAEQQGPPAPPPPADEDVLPFPAAPPAEDGWMVSWQDPSARVMGLSDVLAYAMAHSREFQDAKEALYVAALDLTLERHLWTPQFVAAMRAEFADYGQVRDFDRAMTTVSDLSVSQRLPFGGQVTARIVNSLMRDLGVHTTSGETGSFIMDANIPLFRGAGRVAYESRYRAERELIYAVRTFEHFRRQFLVSIASDYFSLQQIKARIFSARKAVDSARANADRAAYYVQLRRGDPFEKFRAQSTLRQAETDVQNEIENYQSGLDQFKIRLGMSVSEPLDVVNQEDDVESRLIENLLPEVTEEDAIAVALKLRLDLINVLDGIDDAKRGVVVARNAILPELNLSGSMTMNTDPVELNSMSYNTERTTWRGLVELSTNDRYAERNAYRRSFITLRQAERAYDVSADRVRSDVRRALRRVEQSENNREIQRLSVVENEERERAAEELFRLAQRTNQDVVDAQNDLQRARNAFAAAEAGVRRAILEFRRDTGTLRLTDEGEFLEASFEGAAQPGS